MSDREFFGQIPFAHPASPNKIIGTIGVEISS